MKIVILCGGRTFSRYSLIYAALEAERPNIKFVVQGGASGADSHGKNAAVILKLPHLQVDAEWARFGRSAGALRNEKMLEQANKLVGEGDYVEVWAFRDDLWAPDPNTGGNGTLDMCSRALATGVPARWYSRSLGFKSLIWTDDRVVVNGEETFPHNVGAQMIAAARHING